MPYRNLMAAILLAFVGASAHAMPYTLDKQLDPLVLSLADHPEHKGVRWAAAEGVLAARQDYIAVKGISLLSATDVLLMVADPASPATLHVDKFLWNESVKFCTTAADGLCQVAFKTHNDVGFRVSGKPGLSWRLLVTTGPTDNNALPDVLGGAAPEATGVDPQGQPTWFVGLAVLIALCAVAITVWRRRTSAVATSLIIVCAGLVSIDSVAQDTASAGGATNTRSAISEWATALNAPMPGPLGSISREQLGKYAGHAGKIIKSYTSGVKLLDSYQNLDQCSRVANPAGTPRIPSFCADNPECRSCFSSARADFDRTRLTLEQLRVIYSCTTSMTKKAISFGDSGSDVHALTGLAWQAERRKIEDSVKRLNSAYDTKYRELMTSLQDSMQDLNACEVQFGEQDWYDRYGHVYFEFIRDAYRRKQ